MSRPITQPVQSIKLTNVATVRLTVKGKRFEVACYKNKVLDYRAGLETDLSEVLQTSNIHVFTNVGKGQFAAASDLQAAFGEHATQEEIAIQILQKGKSLQISEAERSQLYENTLTQIATWIAANCIHPETGKPYTASQIKHALTSTATTTAATSGSTPQQQQPEQAQSKKKKKKNKKQQQQQQQSGAADPTIVFTVQPHKPIKQQYLSALKYLQAARILPIQRAAMQLQWQYDHSDSTAAVHNEEQVAAILRELDIVPDKKDTPAADDNNNNNETTTITLTVDPSVYRPLHEMATARVPGSRLEIVQQQVFRAQPKTTTTNKKKSKDDNDDDDGEDDLEHEPEPDSKAEEPSNRNRVVDDDDSSKDSSDKDDQVLVQTTSRKNQRKAQKKQQKKAQRRAVLQQHSDSSDDSDENENNVVQAVKTTTAAAPDNNAERITPDSSAKTCNTCVGSANRFATAAAYRAHFRSDWHRFNQKLKLQGAAAVSLQEFQQCDAESFFAKGDDQV